MDVDDAEMSRIRSEMKFDNILAEFKDIFDSPKKGETDETLQSLLDEMSVILGETKPSDKRGSEASSSGKNGLLNHRQ